MARSPKALQTRRTGCAQERLGLPQGTANFQTPIDLTLLANTGGQIGRRTHRLPPPPACRWQNRRAGGVQDSLRKDPLQSEENAPRGKFSAKRSFVLLAKRLPDMYGHGSHYCACYGEGIGDRARGRVQGLPLLGWSPAQMSQIPPGRLLLPGGPGASTKRQNLAGWPLFFLVVIRVGCFGRRGLPQN